MLWLDSDVWWPHWENVASADKMPSADLGSAFHILIDVFQKAGADAALTWTKF